jgi:hypothetical protein
MTVITHLLRFAPRRALFFSLFVPRRKNVQSAGQKADFRERTGKSNQFNDQLPDRKSESRAPHVLS